MLAFCQLQPLSILSGLCLLYINFSQESPTIKIDQALVGVCVLEEKQQPQPQPKMQPNTIFKKPKPQNSNC